MDEPLRPMSTGELLDRTFSLYRRRFLLFVGIAAVAPAILLATQLLLASFGSVAGTPATANSPLATAASVTAIVGLIAGMIAWMAGLVITQAATIRAVAAVHLGQPTSIREAYARLKGRFGRVLRVFATVAIRVFAGSMLLVLVAVAIGTAGVLGGAALGAGGAIAGSIVALAVAVVAGLVAVALFVRYSLAVQACVVEDITASESLKRSVFLTKGSRSRILTVYTLFVVLSWIISGALVLLGAGAVSILGPGLSSTALSYVMQFLAGALTGPLATIAMSLVYFDERVRKEAFDLQLMMASLPKQSAVAAG